MRYRELFEAPIADFNYIDRSEEIDDFSYRPGGKIGPSFQPEDQRALQSPKWRAKLKQTFRNTPEPINFYAVNSAIIKMRSQKSGLVKSQADKIALPKNLSSMREWAGTYHPDDFKENFGFLPPNYESSINIILLQNEGDERVPLTPWIAAHRAIHALMSDDVISSNDDYRHSGRAAFRDAQRMIRGIEDAWEDTHGKVGFDIPFEVEQKVAARNMMFAAVGTMASARNHKIARSGEFIVELFTQYFLTGDFTINLEWKNERKTSAYEIDRIRRFEQDAENSLKKMFEEAVGALIVF